MFIKMAYRKKEKVDEVRVGKDRRLVSVFGQNVGNEGAK